MSSGDADAIGVLIWMPALFTSTEISDDAVACRMELAVACRMELLGDRKADTGSPTCDENCKLRVVHRQEALELIFLFGLLQISPFG